MDAGRGCWGQLNGGVSAAKRPDFNQPMQRYPVQASIDSAQTGAKTRRMAEPSRRGSSSDLSSASSRAPLAVVQKLPVPLTVTVIHRLAAISPNPHPPSTLDSARARAAYPPSTGRNQSEDSASVIGSNAAEGVGACKRFSNSRVSVYLDSLISNLSLYPLASKSCTRRRAD